MSVNLVRILFTHSNSFKYIYQRHSFGLLCQEGKVRVYRASRETELGIRFTPRPLYYQKVGPGFHRKGRWADVKVECERLGQDKKYPARNITQDCQVHIRVTAPTELSGILNVLI